MGSKMVKNEVREGLEIRLVSKVGPKGARGRPRAPFLVDLGGILVRFRIDFLENFASLSCISGHIVSPVAPPLFPNLTSSPYTSP